MSITVIRGGRIIDPSQQIDQVADLFLEDDRVLGIDLKGFDPDEQIDASDKIVTPGFIDMHVHFREPGGEESETIASGAAAAIAGGVTTVACQPNTTPAIDNPDTARFVRDRANDAALANVFPVCAATVGRRGERLTDFAALAECNAVGYTDDGDPIDSAELMRLALLDAKALRKAVMTHSEVRELTRGGVMNEGDVSRKLGVKGMPGLGEEIMIARDLMLAEATGGHLHVQHISTRPAVALVRQGKEKGIHVTTEACPHHFLLTDETLAGRDTNFKMSPPLRTATDIRAVLEGLVDGTIEVLATDHAPHSAAKKSLPLEKAPFGIIGLETLLPLSIKALIEPGLLSWSDTIEKLTINPARILGIPKGTLQPNADADVTIIDPDLEWTVDPTQFHSKSINSPFSGWTVRGKATLVIVGGVTKLRDGKLFA